MKRFEFNLQSILELRQREEDEAQAFLMEQEAQYQRAADEFNRKKEELQNFQKREKETRKEAGATVSTLKYSVSWRNSLKFELLKLGQQMQDISFDVTRAKERLIKATVKRKSLETLRDKKMAAWQKEFNKNEQKFLDEIAQMRR